MKLPKNLSRALRDLEDYHAARADTPPPWPDAGADSVRPRMIAALRAMRDAPDVAAALDGVRAARVQASAVHVRISEYGLETIRAASDAELAVIADYPSPALIAAMDHRADVAALLARPCVALKVAAYKAAALPQGPDVGHRPWAEPPAWRSALRRVLGRSE